MTYVKLFHTPHFPHFHTLYMWSTVEKCGILWNGVIKCGMVQLSVEWCKKVWTGGGIKCGIVQ